MNERVSPALAGFALAALVSLGLAAGVYWISDEQGEAAKAVSHTHEVLARLAGARASLLEIQSGQRGFVLTGREDSLDPYRHGLVALRSDLDRLRSLLFENPEQGRRIESLEEALAPRLAVSRQVIEVRRERGFEAARTLIDSGLPARQMAGLHGRLAAMEEVERGLLDARAARYDDRLRWFRAGVAALVAALLGALALLYVQARRRQGEEEALLRSEQRFHLMTQGVVDYAIYMLDPRGIVMSWNAGAERIKGYREDEIVGASFERFFLPEDVARGAPREALEAAAAQGRFECEAWRVRKDGSRFWASVVITAMRDPGGALIGFAKVTRDLTERRRMDAELEDLNGSLERLVLQRTAALTATNEELLEARTRLRELSSRLITAQEEERKRIARELHDETGQALTGIRLRLTNALRADTAHGEGLEECVRIVDQAVAHIRDLAIYLRPPMLDDLGLVDALDWALCQQAKAAGWAASVVATGLPERLHPEIETACFRIGQEAITNIARHARALNVRIELMVDGRGLHLTVADDGQGFEQGRFASPGERRKHFGLVSMAERASLLGGTLEVESGRGAGTIIRANFPLAGAR